MEEGARNENKKIGWPELARRAGHLRIPAMSNIIFLAARRSRRQFPNEFSGGVRQ
jgi:hypothetical protein